MTRADVEFLCALAKLHYDAVCRRAEEAGPDAFLNGARNQFWKPETETAVIEWSFRECDISRKILECTNFIRDGGPFGDWRAAAAHAFELDRVLCAAQTSINEESARLNK
jgi:hypothetical protein